MHFVLQYTRGRHGNLKEPEWLMIDYKEHGVRTGWALGTGHNDWVWGHDLFEEIMANPEKFLIVEAKDYKDLQTTREYKEKWNEYVISAIDPKSNLGWVAPDGTFIGCGYYDHSFVAKEYLESGEEELEGKGWCKIFALGQREAENNEINYFVKYNHFTDAQKEFIKRHNEKFPCKTYPLRMGLEHAYDDE